MIDQVRIRIIAVLLLIPVFVGVSFIETYDWRPGIFSTALESTATSDGMTALSPNLTPDHENAIQSEHISFLDPEADGAMGRGVEAEENVAEEKAAEDGAAKENTADLKTDPASVLEAGAGTVIEGGTDTVGDGEGAVWFDGAPWKAPVGKWFEACGATSQPVAVDEVIPSKSCPEGCNGNGVCNHDMGQCRCTTGFKGPSCADVDVFPCNYHPETDWPFGQWVVTVCSAECDTTRARCQCGARSPFPTRSMASPCGFKVDENGQGGWDLPGTQAVNETSMYSSDPADPGWCYADPRSAGGGGGQPLATCDCLYEGWDGLLCEIPTAQFCLGGCNNRGECDSGYCKCRDGWFGIDCSLPSAFASPPTLHDSPPQWLGGGNFSVEQRRRRGEEGVGGGGGAAGIRRVQRKRPLVYVYDLPPEFSSQVLQGRPYKFGCVPWTYDVRNDTQLNFGYMYGMEIIIHDAFLSSPHRTTNAEEADFFYVPLAGGCIIERADDSPRFEMRHTFANIRPHLLATYVERVLTHVRSNYSFWDRHEGKDHLWTFPWDEGACYAPQSIWSSTLLSPWGNTHTLHRGHTSVYEGDNWSKVPKDIRGDHPCFDPVKDVVMPPYKNPEEWRLEGRLWER